jgi:hypothetical protein
MEVSVIMFVSVIILKIPHTWYCGNKKHFISLQSEIEDICTISKKEKNG